MDPDPTRPLRTPWDRSWRVRRGFSGYVAGGLLRGREFPAAEKSNRLWGVPYEIYRDKAYGTFDAYCREEWGP